MSLYDKASLIFSGAAGAGNKDVAYNIKPVEKLKVDEYVTNGGFDDDSSWTKVNDPIFSNGQVRFQASDGTNRKIYQTGVFEADKTYRVSLDVVELKEGDIRIGTGHNSVEITSVANGGAITKPGSHSFVFKNKGRTNDDWIFIQPNTPASNYDFTIDNVSVREVEQKANDFSFVRASDLTATYEGADGLIKKTRENLLTYSNNFDNAVWAGSSTWTSGQGGYDGSTDAWSFNKNSPSGSDFYNQFFHGLHTFSIYAKKQSNAGLAIYAFYDWNGSSFDGNVRVMYNLDTGTELSNQSGIISTTCEAIGSSWWRISMTVKQDDMRWYLYTTDGTQTLVDDVTVTLQDAQLEQGLVATPYIHRTDSYSKSTAGIQEDEPRYDYSLDNDAPPALLYEPYSGNKIEYSEYFEGTGWSATAEGDGVVPTITTNYAVSPDGSKNATRLQLDLGGGTTADDRSRIQFSAGTYPGGFQTNSLYVKSNSGTVTVFIRTIDQIEVVSVGEDWKRVSASHSNPSGYFEFGIDGFRCPNDTVDLCIWGAQIENLNHTTSYMPSHGSIVTRAKETIPQYTPSKTNLDKYTFFAHSHSDRVVDDNRAPRLKGHGNFALMGIFVNGAGKKQFFLYDNENNSTLSKTTFGSFEAGDDTKYAFVVDNIALKAKLFIDGSLRETISLTERVDASIVSVGNSSGNPDRIKSIMYFPEALEDADVVSLTT